MKKRVAAIDTPKQTFFQERDVALVLLRVYRRVSTREEAVQPKILIRAQKTAAEHNVRAVWRSRGIAYRSLSVEELIFSEAAPAEEVVGEIFRGEAKNDRAIIIVGCDAGLCLQLAQVFIEKEWGAETEAGLVLSVRMRRRVEGLCNGAAHSKLSRSRAVIQAALGMDGLEDLRRIIGGSRRFR